MSEQSKMTNEEAFEKFILSDDWQEIRLHAQNSDELAENVWRAAIAYMQEQSEPVGELILDPVFLPALKAPLVNWKINLVDLEVGTKLYTSPQRQQPLKRLSDEQVELKATNDMFWEANGFSSPKLKWDEFANAIMDAMQEINK